MISLRPRLRAGAAQPHLPRGGACLRCCSCLLPKFPRHSLQTFANYRIAVPGIKSLTRVFEKKFCRRVGCATVETPTHGAESASAKRSLVSEEMTKGNCGSRRALACGESSWVTSDR